MESEGCYWPMLLMSRDLILLMCVSVFFMSVTSLVLRCSCELPVGGRAKGIEFIPA